LNQRRSLRQPRARMTITELNDHRGRESALRTTQRSNRQRAWREERNQADQGRSSTSREAKLDRGRLISDLLRDTPVTSDIDGRDEDLSTVLDAVTSTLRSALEHLHVPMYLLDRSGRIRWLNEAARQLVGDAEGRDITEVVAPEHTRRAKEAFTRKLFGEEATDFEVNLLGPDGRRIPVQVSSVPLKDGGRVVGVFGVARATPRRREPPVETPPAGLKLTPRQDEVLGLLGAGCSTSEIAEELGVSIDTVRNHIREILRRLRVHSRVEALAVARRYGLL
jgi:PAS domain S-box-containing protein